jgi:hypothetical protein
MIKGLRHKTGLWPSLLDIHQVGLARKCGVNLLFGSTRCVGNICSLLYTSAILVQQSMMCYFRVMLQMISPSTMVNFLSLISILSSHRVFIIWHVIFNGIAVSIFRRTDGPSSRGHYPPSRLHKTPNLSSSPFIPTKYETIRMSPSLAYGLIWDHILS